MGVGSGKFCVHLGRANWRNPHICIITKPATSRSTLTTEYRSCRLCAARLRECVWVKSRSILIHSYCNHPIIHFCPTQFYLDIVKRIVDIAKLERSNFGIEANIPDDIAEVVFSGPMFETVTEMDWETLFKIYSYSKRGLDNQEMRDLVEEVEDEIKSSLSTELREVIQ